MKNIGRFCALFLLSILVLSCTEDISRPNPAIQGLKDGVMWRANDQYAELDQNGGLTIIGLTQYETLTLKTQNHNEGTFILGNSTARQATFSESRGAQDVVFSTGANFGDGQIVITDYDEVANTVTGSFRFNAINQSTDPEAGNLLNFQQGNFYKVRVISATAE